MSVKNLLEIDPAIIAERDELLMDPVTIRVNDFTEEAAEELSEAFAKAHLTGQAVIPVVIDSYGGEASSLLAMIAEFESSRIPVATIGVGKAMSCGAILLGCGTAGHRYCDRNASIMIHDISSGVAGKTAEVLHDAREMERLQRQIYGLLADRTGHDDRSYYLQELMRRGNAEWYLTAPQARKIGLIDRIGLPCFRTRIKVEQSFGLFPPTR